MTPRSVFWAAFLPLAAYGHQGLLAHLMRAPGSLGTESLLALGAMAARLGAMAWLLCLARAAGAPLLRRLRVGFAEPAERAVHEAALGLGAIHHALFALGLLGLWRREVFIALLALTLLPAWKARPRLALPRFGDRLDALLAVPLALAALHFVLASNAPVADWDSLAMHLEHPRHYARDGAFTPLTWLLHGLDALAGGLFLVPALSFGQEELAPHFMGLFGALMVFGVWAAGRRLAGPRAALAAAALLAVSPRFAGAAGTAGSDYVVGLWGMLAFAALWHGRKEGGGWLLLSGAFTGLAAVTKPSGFLLAAALLPVLAFDARRRGDRAGPLLWAAAAALAAAPWLLRAAWLTGNPLWPHFAGLFGGDARALWLAERSRRHGAGLADALGGSWPLLLPLAAAAAASWRALRRDEWAARLGAHAACFAAAWLAVYPDWRYMIPLMPWLYLLAARAAASPGLAAALAAGLLPAAGLGANNEAFAALRLRPSDGSPPREAYLRRRVDVWPALDRANRTLPADAKVLLYREVRGYHLERPYLVGDPQNELALPYETLSSPEQLQRRLAAAGVTHVLVNPAHQTFVTAPDFLRADELMARTLHERAALLHETNGVRLYALKRF